MATLQEKLGESQINIKRGIRQLRDHFHAPIDYDRSRNGYHYLKDGNAFELPGLWFGIEELYSLLVSERLLAAIQPGLFDDLTAPLHQRIEKMLADGKAKSSELPNRLRILSIGGRKVRPTIFLRVISALLERKQLAIAYRKPDAADSANPKRRISPQRLIRYRDNWYVDAWCHEKRALRSFALDRILAVQPEKIAAKNIPDTQLNAHFASGYGIFAGAAKHIAVLRFSATLAQRVAAEEWHPVQQGKFTEDGRYELRIPYAQSPELVMDILKYGAEVEVVAPKSLREKVANKIRAAAAHYD